MEEYKIKFNKQYTFEGKEYAEIDLSALNELKGADILEAERYATRLNMGLSVGAENSADYALYLASRAAKVPVEFFNGLPAKDALKVRRKMRVFLFS